MTTVCATEGQRVLQGPGFCMRANSHYSKVIKLPPFTDENKDPMRQRHRMMIRVPIPLQNSADKEE
jgi:hypothetical protein